MITHSPKHLGGSHARETIDFAHSRHWPMDDWLLMPQRPTQPDKQPEIYVSLLIRYLFEAIICSLWSLLDWGGIVSSGHRTRFAMQ